MESSQKNNRVSSSSVREVNVNAGPATGKCSSSAVRGIGSSRRVDRCPLAKRPERPPIAGTPSGMSRALGESLGVITLFASLDPAVRLRIADLCRSRRFAPDQPVINHHDDSADVYFLLEGTVRATLYSRQGREIAFQDLQAGSMFGELAAIDGRPRSTAVVATQACAVAIMSPTAFRAMLGAHPGIAFQVLERLSALTRRLCDRVVEFSTLDVRERVRCEVYRLARERTRNGNIVVIENFPTHAELASRISTHREAVTREINALDKSGIVDRTGGRFVVSDLAALQLMVSELRS